MSPFERLRGAHLTKHPVIEDLVFSVLSLLVVTVAILAIVSPPKASIALAAKPIDPGTTQKIFIYGKLVDENGVGIAGATITVTYRDGKKAMTVVTAADGTFTMQFTDGPSPYPVEVQVGNTVGTTTLACDPGMKWGITMTFVQPSSFVFVPLPGY